MAAIGLGACALLLFVAAPASAQWYVAGFGGSSHMQTADVSIAQPPRATSLEIAGVAFDSRSFSSPPYYGASIGWLHGDDSRWQWGLEVEYVHAKAYAQTSRMVRFSGQLDGAPMDRTAPMDTIVSRYAMSHGLNVALASVVFRVPLGGPPGRPSRAGLILRAGAGPAIPHGESTVEGEPYESYQAGGVAFHGAAGLDVRLAGGLSGLVDYQITLARPTIAIAQGTGRVTAVVHQIALGVRVWFPNRD